MKRIIFILSLVLMFANANSTEAATSTKNEIKAVKSVLKSQIESANKYSFPDFVKFFDLQYVNSDGFNIDVYSKLVEETWSVYPNIQYAQTIKNITITDKDAIAEVVETANAQVQSQYDLKGSLKSVANNVYFLRKTPDGWRIVSDAILTENTYLAFGEMVNHLPTLTVPYQTLANKSYTATLEYTVPKDAIAIASINQERVSYPQESMKENYRKLPEDGILERFFTANGDSTNEYVVASLGLTRPKFEDKDLQISITGIAYIIKRVNVVPENRFINLTDVTTVGERLKKYAQPVATEEAPIESKEVKAIKADVENIEESADKAPTEAKSQEEPVLQPSEETKKTEPTETSSNVETDDLKAEIPATAALTKEEKDTLKKVADKQKALEKEAKIRAEQEKKQLKQAEKEKAKAEKLAKKEAEQLAKQEKKLEAIKLKEEKKATKLAKQEAKKAEKAEQKVAKEKLQKEKKEEKLNKKEAKQKQKKEKKLNKGAFSPETIGIPVSTTVCPIENIEVANDKK